MWWLVLMSYLLLRPVAVSPSAYRTLQRVLPEADTVQVFQTSRGSYWVEAQYADGTRRVHQLSAGQYRRLLQGFPLQALQTASLAERFAFVGGQAVVALVVYPWAVPMMFTPESQAFSTGAKALGLLSPLLWTTGSALYAWNQPVPLSQAYAGFWGGLFGAFHGGMVVNSGRGSFPGSLLGNLANQYLARRYHLSLGSIQRLVNGQLYGYYHYLMLKSLLNLSFEPGSVVPYRIATTLSVTEGYAELLISRNDTAVTLGDALFELRTALIGAEALPSLLLAYDLYRGEVTSSRVYAGLSLLGHGVGWLLGRYLSRRYDVSVPGALLTYLAPGLSQTFASGFMELLRPSPSVRPVLFIATEVGVTALTYRLVRQVPVPRYSWLQNLAPLSRVSTLPGQGPVFGVQMRF